VIRLTIPSEQSSRPIKLLPGWATQTLADAKHEAAWIAVVERRLLKRVKGALNSSMLLPQSPARERQQRGGADIDSFDTFGWSSAPSWLCACSTV
jgi:hypothetical protein